MLVATRPRDARPAVFDRCGRAARRRASCTRASCGSTRTRSSPVPYAAQSWRWRDPLTLEVTLRDDVRFHSGAPLDGARCGGDAARHRVAQGRRRGTRASSRPSQSARAEGDARGGRAPRARRTATLLTDLELPILRADQAESPPAPDGSLDGLGPYSVARGDAGRPAPRAGERRRAPAPRPRGRASAPCTTRTRARCGSRRGAPTWP